TLHAQFVCANSACRMLCTEGNADCDKLVDDGCEINTDGDPQNCGACGHACAAGQICYLGACGCPPGYTQCDDQCVQTDRDFENCGACHNECDPATAPNNAATWPCGQNNFPPNTQFDCHSSMCGLECAPGTGNCNADQCGDGCETDLTADPANCGA